MFNCSSHSSVVNPACAPPQRLLLPQPKQWQKINGCFSQRCNRFNLHLDTYLVTEALSESRKNTVLHAIGTPSTYSDIPFKNTELLSVLSH